MKYLDDGRGLFTYINRDGSFKSYFAPFWMLNENPEYVFDSHNRKAFRASTVSRHSKIIFFASNILPEMVKL